MDSPECSQIGDSSQFAVHSSPTTRHPSLQRFRMDHRTERRFSRTAAKERTAPSDVTKKQA